MSSTRADYAMPRPATASWSLKSTQGRWLLLAGLGAALLLFSLLAIGQGAVSISAGEIMTVLLQKLGLSGQEVSAIREAVVLNIRLPRVVLGVLVGGGLAVAGAAMQGLFRNPLADPGIIGVSSGGAIGAITMIVLGVNLLPASWYQQLGPYLVPLAAMAGAMGMTFLIYRLARIGGQVDLVSMLLIGIAINAIGGAFIGFLTFIASDDQLRSLTFWGLGSLGRADWELIRAGSLFILIPLCWLPFFSRELNALLLGEEEAQHLGIDVGRAKTKLIVLAASLVGAATALCGTIGFIALVVPHMVRSLIGPDHRFLLPASALLGGVLLLFADMVARTVVAPAELPIGILTSLLGGPVFLGLLLRRQRQAR
ncbi:MAG: iron complex transport system permease protein [Puniceicoccaceae bacterium 5H]|nr:MAG: iron complex transport system permease protein [Puniceicoccaceae bacterium 5H]